jgi:hypothetical protein
LTVGTGCSECLERTYCIDGTKGSEFCESGGICLKAATKPVQTQAHPALDFYTCPVGYYCEKPGDTKTNLEIKCPTSKYTYTPGASKLDDCEPCRAGSYCATNAAPQDCPVGAYCVKGAKAFKQCPIYFYNGLIKGINERSCKPCAPGYYCDTIQTGVLVTADKCKAGHYCPEGTIVEVPCPFGTYIAVGTFGLTVADCSVCP